jgi:hypothetical protein
MAQRGCATLTSSAALLEHKELKLAPDIEALAFE